jgi:putative transposase
MCSLFRNRFRYNSMRYSGRDYSLPGKYFVTICTAGTKKWFGHLINGNMHLSEIGQIASQMWYEIPVHFPFIGLDAFVVMPNHIHGIIVINRSIVKPMVGTLHATPLLPHGTTHLADKTMSSISPKSGSLSVIVRSYKSAVTKNVHKLDSHFSCQHGFYDTIICTTGQLFRIIKYILDNAQNRDLSV